MEDSREELEAYRKRVFEELKARALKVQEIDTAIASNQYLLDLASSSRGLRSGNTLRVIAGASHKAKLKREHERLARQRREAAADLTRAEERLADVDRELEELEAGHAREGAIPTEHVEEGES